MSETDREKAARLRARLDAESDPRARAVANAKAFLRAGGTISWDRWRSLDDSSRAALVEASEDVAQDRAILVARALAAFQSGPPRPTHAPTHDDLIDQAMARAAARRTGFEDAAGMIT